MVVASSPSGLLFFCLNITTGDCINQALLADKEPNLEAVIKDGPAVVSKFPVPGVDVQGGGERSACRFKLPVTVHVARQP